MTEMNEKQLLEMIEKLLAGEEPAQPSGTDAEYERLLGMARELVAARPEPEPGFAEALADRLGREAEGARSENTPAGHGVSRWFPGWVTWRRVAAVSATLVLGLGVAGMTRAVLEGGGPLEDNASVAATDYDVRDSSGLEEKQSFDEALGVSGADSVAGPAQGAGEDATVAPEGDMVSPGTVIPELRRVIQTADYEIEVPVGDFQDRYSDITDLAARYGGYVIAADSSVTGKDDEQLKQGHVTIRIANTGDNFIRAQKELEDLGKVVSRQISGEDVSEQFVDLQSRLRNAESQQAQLLALMEKATTIEEILLVQSRLDEVQMQIEQLKGSIEYLETQTDYATISVEIYEEDVETDAVDEDDGIDWRFVESVKYAGWLAVQTVNFVIIALGVIVPALLILTALSLVAYRVINRRRSRGDSD